MRHLVDGLENDIHIVIQAEKALDLVQIYGINPELCRSLIWRCRALADELEGQMILRGIEP
jgi:hypothetical protein